MTRDTYSETDRQTTIQDLNTYADTLRDASSLFEEKVDELSLLRRIGNIVGYLFDKEVFYHKLIDILLEETPAENCSFMLIDADTDKLIIKMARGRNDHGTFFEHPQDSETLFSLGEGIAGKVALGKEIILINEVSEDRRFKIRETRFPINSLLCAPLIFKDKAIGVINLSSSRAHAFKESHKRVLQLLCTFVSSIIAHAAAYIKARDQEKFEAMFEGVKFPILLLDPKTMKITECNNYTEEWLGYGREELLRKENVFEAVPPEHRDRALHIIREIRSKNNLAFYELPFIKKEGSIALTEINGTLISYQERKAIQLTIRDITEAKHSQEALRSTRDYLDNIIESSLDSIVVSDGTGHITRVNKSLLTMLGYQEEELVGKISMVLSPTKEGLYQCTTGEVVPIDKNFFKESWSMLRRLQEEGKISSWELYFIRKDTTVIPVEQNIVYLYNKSGKVTGTVSIIRDITERKKAINQLKEARDSLVKVIEASIDGIIIMDAVGTILSVNTAVEKITGIKKADIIGTHISQFSPLDEQRKKEIRAILMEEFFEKGYACFEYTWHKEDGSAVEMEQISNLVKDEQGNSIAAISIIRDVTQRKLAEKEIKRTRDFLENILEGSRDGIIITDEKGYILFTNSAVEQISGFKKEAAMGMHASTLTVPDEDMRKTALEKTKELFERGFTTYETLHKSKEGRVIHVECTTTLIKDEKEAFIAAVSILRDITERNEMEHKLIQSEKLKSLGELAGGVAHDFNNVLAAIFGRAQLLKLHIDTPRGTTERRKSVSDLKKSLEVIEKAALDGAETVRRIQDFARTRGNDDYLSLININEAIDYAIEFTKVRWKNEAEAKGVTYHIKKELSSLPPLKGSAAELREVVTNLINNALDAMPQGGQITIKTFKDNHHLSVKISDTGSGIPASIQDRIFDPFFTTKGVQATGLGLSVSYGIITRHRGMITVDSVEGRGATFTIQFPLTEHIRNKKHHHKKVTPPSPERQKVRILIIEDEKEVREVLHDILSHAGYEVETAPQGNEGVELFKQKHFDAVFTDLGMPGMSGWQVAEEIKKINNKTFVALITGWEVNLQSNELKENKVDLVVHKPFQIDQLLQLVQKALQARRD